MATIFYNFNQNAVTFVERLKRKTSWEKHWSLAFKNTKMSTLPKHVHWTWTILSEWIMCGMNYKWEHYKKSYSESAVAEHEWARREWSLASKSRWTWWLSMEGISQLDSELSYGRSVEGGKWFSSQAFPLKFLKFWRELRKKGKQKTFLHAESQTPVHSKGKWLADFR